MDKKYWKKTGKIGAIVTIIYEVGTILSRVFSGISAGEFHERYNLPILLRIHHMFWGIFFFIIGLTIARRLPKYSPWIAGIGIGLFLSDVIHHFIVLPLWIGNIGWHWP
ncbi:hypothetical protein JW926_03635 [Candidatus Sumerlaeota bacterium]|nr:hypothetical protein [Candidatus Sumerlaeota bacterium]